MREKGELKRMLPVVVVVVVVHCKNDLGLFIALQSLYYTIFILFVGFEVKHCYF